MIDVTDYFCYADEEEGDDDYDGDECNGYALLCFVHFG